MKIFKNGSKWTGKSLVKLQNQSIFEKFEWNRKLRRVSCKMMYNMSSYVIGSQMNSGGGGARNPS